MIYQTVVLLANILLFGSIDDIDKKSLETTVEVDDLLESLL